MAKSVSSAPVQTGSIPPQGVASRHAAPERWDKPFSADMQEVDVDLLLAHPLFVATDPRRFPRVDPAPGDFEKRCARPPLPARRDHRAPGGLRPLGLCDPGRGGPGAAQGAHGGAARPPPAGPPVRLGQPRPLVAAPPVCRAGRQPRCGGGARAHPRRRGPHFFAGRAGRAGPGPDRPARHGGNVWRDRRARPHPPHRDHRGRPGDADAGDPLAGPARDPQVFPRMEAADRPALPRTQPPPASRRDRPVLEPVRRGPRPGSPTPRGSRPSGSSTGTTPITAAARPANASAWSRSR
jgi:hypothetical protein